MQQNRQLAAILFTDMVGYTAIMQQDEQTALAIMRHYIGVLKQLVTEHNGQILNDYGDGSLCSFPSATQAVKCAVEIQKQLQKWIHMLAEANVVYYLSKRGSQSTKIWKFQL